MPTEEKAMTSGEKAALRVYLLEQIVADLVRDITANLARQSELDQRHRRWCQKLQRARALLGEGRNDDVEQLLEEETA